MNGQDRDALKKRLLAQSKDRPRGRRAEPDIATNGGATSSENRLTRFDSLPQYRQITLMREGAERLGLKDPFFRPHDGIAGATSVVEGREVINFASYNYLGLAGDPRVTEAAKAALDRYGTTVSASRIVSGERPIHRELEVALARAYASDDAVAFVSGHATNVSTLGQLLGPRDLIVHDEWIHNSAVVGAQLSGAKRMSFAHNNPQALNDLLVRHRHSFERIAVVIEGLYSMDGDVPDLGAFVDIKRRHQAWLMVDEAHSFGVLGEHGRGLGEYTGVASNEVDIWMGTLSKSLASCGGYIAGCQALVDTLRYLAPGFLYSVGMPAQAAAPALAALTLMQREPERLSRLQRISRYFRDQARAAGLDTGRSIGVAVVPIITGNSPAAALLSQRLFDAGINVQPIVYPAVPERSARLRFFLSSEHTEAQVDETIVQLKQAHRALGQ